LSSRRVKKGPGRRPQSVKRQRFMELRSRGWSIVAAARVVGVSRTAGNNWSRGYKVYRDGQVTGFVPALDRLAVRQISARYLSQDERIEIADLRHAGLGIRQIADQLGRAPSTISRELRRNATAGGYRPFEARRRATANRARNHRRRLETNDELRQLVAELLVQRWSPEQISRRRYPEMRIEPLRSAEPGEVTDEQRAELDVLPERQEYRPPSWVRELAEARKAFSEKLAERQSVAEPHEDPDYADVGPAFPSWPQQDRDVVLQPPKPPIPPSERLAEREAEASEREL
jgi:predicted transcriptional regulator